MIRAFRSEWYKIRRISVLSGALAMLGLTAVAVYFGITKAPAKAAFPGQATLAGLSEPGGLVFLLDRASFILTVISVIVISASMGAEYTQGTLRNLLVREPGRLRLVAGKFLANLLFLEAAAVAAIAAASLLALVLAPGRGVNTAGWLNAGWGGDLQFVGNTLLAIVGWSALGLFFALVFRSAAAAVGVTLAYGLAVENLAVQVLPDIRPWLPGQLLQAIANGGTSVIPYSHALTFAAMYVVMVLVVGGVLLRFRDVTS